MMSDLRGVVANPRFNLFIRFHNLPFFFLYFNLSHLCHSLYIGASRQFVCFFLSRFFLYLSARALFTLPRASLPLAFFSLSQFCLFLLAQNTHSLFLTVELKSSQENIDNFGKAYFFRISQIRVRAFYWIIETECFWLFWR